jgi:RimJ/RimL family protein N-acetyltransferase
MDGESPARRSYAGGMSARFDTSIPPQHVRASAEGVESCLIGHYPTELIDVRTFDGDQRLTLRPVLPQDNRLLAELVNRVSERSRSHRFPNAPHAASADQLARLACIDYRRHLALVASFHEGGREWMVAEARYLIDPDGQSAEFMLMVDDAWQRNGIATWALLALSRAAEAAGVHWLRCDVLADNEAMLALLRRRDFCCAVDRGDRGIVHAETRARALNARAAASRAKPLKWIQRWLPSGRLLAGTQS